MKSKYTILIIPILAILLSSCLSVRIPEPNSSTQAITIIPMEYLDEAPGTFYADYQFYGYRTDIGSNLPFIIDVSVTKRFNTYRHLPGTTNEIRKITEIMREDGKNGATIRYNDIRFELQGGKINVIPYMVRVELVRSKEPGENRRPIQRLYFDPLRDHEYKQIVSELVELGTDESLIVLGAITESAE